MDISKSVIHEPAEGASPTTDPYLAASLDVTVNDDGSVDRSVVLWVGDYAWDISADYARGLAAALLEQADRLER